MGSACVLVGLISGVLPLLLLGLGVAVAMTTLITTNGMALGINLAPTRRGSAAALLGIASFAVGGVMAPLSGLGDVMLGVMMLLFTVVGLAVHATLAPRQVRIAEGESL